MNRPQRGCPDFQAPVTNIWRHGDIEMASCPRCGKVPLATVYDGPLPVVEYESEFQVFAINDGTSDYFLRLARLVPECNVVQLKKLEVTANDRRIVPLGIRTDTIDLPSFMNRVTELRLTVELKPVGE